MDEQKIDPLRTNPQPGDGAHDAFTQDNNREPTSVPLVGGNDRPSTGAGSDIDGPDLGGPELDVPEDDLPELDVPEDDVPDLDLPDDDVPELGEPDVGGNDIGGTGRDGLSGGIGSDTDLTGPRSPSGSPRDNDVDLPGSDGVLPGDELEHDIDLDRHTTAPTG